ncbi:MAG TPA: TrbM/KikA/MpfK family conjugal transfer protein [Limnobacter sp.]|uniref:TrbM/KikA/MpfK family conjugal transfer protein n=1 Tax=Limnobacter sp. TaxID=2003368 RepID=UPI002ED8F6DA
MAFNTGWSEENTPQVLEGDVRLACEAKLCLTSPNSPSECEQSLNRYFSIRFKKARDTINARNRFLNLRLTSQPNSGTQFSSVPSSQQ